MLTLITATAEDLPGGVTAHHVLMLTSIASAILTLVLIGSLALVHLYFFTVP